LTTQPYRYVCRNFTTFDDEGRFDEQAFRGYLQRFIEPNIGIFPASSGTGVGQALEWEELRAIYRSAVEECKGKILVGANIPEQFSAQLSLEHANLAAECNVDIVNIYGPDGRHSYRPTDQEYLTYFDRILAEFDHPISLNPLPALGYTPKSSVIAELANKYHQVAAIILTGINDDQYFLDLKNMLTREVDIFCIEAGSLNTLLLGAAGLAGNVAAMIPRTYRRYLDDVAAGKYREAMAAYEQIRRFMQYSSKSAQWAGGTPRVHQMFLTIFKQAGGGGRLPDPYLNVSDSDRERFAAGILELGVPEVDELAQAAGLR
jgi:dihydrodipicolinate synthase/N-acetylneuraminate lyase